MRRTLSALAAGVLVVALASPAMGADKNQSDNPPKAGPASTRAEVASSSFFMVAHPENDSASHYSGCSGRARSR